MPNKEGTKAEVRRDSGKAKEDGGNAGKNRDATPREDDGLDAILFVQTDDEGLNEEEEEDDEEEGDDEEEEVDPCLMGEEEDDEEEATSQVAPEKSMDKTVIDKSSKRYRRHQFIKHEICIPDKSRKGRPVPRGRPWYLQKKRDALEKRQDSDIVFVMPKQEDPEVIALRKTNKMVQKLIKYMKKSWKIRVDRKQEDRELEHRTLPSVYTRKPDDWVDLIRDREERSLQTGFFSPLDVPYEALIDLELDTALLTFKNLPPDLKITVITEIYSAWYN